MGKKDSKDWQEVVISIGDKNTTQSIRRAAKTGVSDPSYRRVRQ